MKKINKAKAGFTLIELVVVMVILGILAGIAVFKLGGSDKGAYLSTMKNDLRGAIAVEQNLYATDFEYAEDAVIDNSNGKEPIKEQICNTSTCYDVTVSPYNTLEVKAKDCGNSVGFYVKVTNKSKVGTAEFVKYDSCIDGGIKHIKP